MTLRQLEILRAIIRCRTTMAAARQLGLSQPAVSNALKAMETQAGFALFERINNRLFPTREALALHEEADLVEVARGFNGPVLAAMPRAALSLYEADLRAPAAWIFGSEGAGVRAKLLACATQQVRVPMAGVTESLNVAATAAVCLFEQVRQRSASPK